MYWMLAERSEQRTPRETTGPQQPGITLSIQQCSSRPNQHFSTLQKIQLWRTFRKAQQTLKENIANIQGQAGTG